MADVKQSALSIPVSFEKIADYIQDDSRFTKVKIWLMHTGLNYNKSIFDKEVVDAIKHYKKGGKIKNFTKKPFLPFRRYDLSHTL